MPRKKGIQQKPKRAFDDLSDLDPSVIITHTEYLIHYLDISMTVIEELGNNLEKLEESLRKFNWHAKATANDTEEAVKMMTRWIYSLPRNREIVLAELSKRRERMNRQLTLARLRKEQQAKGQQTLDFLDILMQQAKKQD